MVVDSDGTLGSNHSTLPSRKRMNKTVVPVLRQSLRSADLASPLVLPYTKVDAHNLSTPDTICDAMRMSDVYQHHTSAWDGVSSI